MKERVYCKPFDVNR